MQGPLRLVVFRGLLPGHHLVAAENEFVMNVCVFAMCWPWEYSVQRESFASSGG